MISDGRGRDHFTLALLFFVAICAYLPGIGWGLPYANSRGNVDVWSPDDIAPLAALTEMYNTFVSPGPDRFLVYPLFHHFLIASASAPYLAWLYLTGQFGAPSPTYPFGLADPIAAFRTITVIARVISIVMAAGITLAAYDIGRTLWDQRVGLLAFVASLVPYPMFYYSKTGNLDVPALFWTALGFAVYARILRWGFTAGRGAALGAFAAFAAATKDHDAAAFLLLPIALVPLAYRRDATARDGQPAWRRNPMIVLLLTGAGTYAVASGLLIDPERYVAHVQYLFSEKDHHSRFADFVTWYPGTVDGVLRHLGDIFMSQFWSLGPGLLVTVVAGLVAAWRDRTRLAFALPGVSHLVIFLLPLGYFYLRFAMSLTFVLAIFAASGALVGLDRDSRVRRIARAGFVAAALAWPLLLGIDLVSQMRRDSRYAAAEWLAHYTTAGQQLAHFNPPGELPRLTEGVTPLRLPPGDDARSALARTRPEFVVIQPDWTSRPDVVHSGLCPPELYDALRSGSLGYVLAARFRSQSLVSRQLLDYPSVNPPVEIYARRDLWIGRP